MRRPWPLAILLLVSSCRDTDGPEDDSARLIEVVGTAQVGGTPLDTVAEPLTVRITDLEHHPVAGATVTWTTTDGGVLVPQAAATDADGIARALWVLGWRVGQQEATATMADAQEAAVFTATAAAFQATSLSTGDDSHACAIAEAGGLFCWGPNENGQLGDGSSTGSERPVAVQLELPAAQVVTSRIFSCALTTGGSVYCWGGNDLGQLGIGSTTPSPIPGGLERNAVRWTLGASHKW